MNLKCFLSAVAGLLFTLVAIAVIAPLHSDYLSRSRASQVLAMLSPIKMEIGKEVVRLGAVDGAGSKFNRTVAPTDKIAYWRILDDGTIIAQVAEDGQIILLIPELTNAKLTWRCVAGSFDDVPNRCQEAS